MTLFLWVGTNWRGAASVGVSLPFSEPQDSSPLTPHFRAVPCPHLGQRAPWGGRGAVL